MAIIDLLKWKWNKLLARSAATVISRSDSAACQDALDILQAHVPDGACRQQELLSQVSFSAHS